MSLAFMVANRSIDPNTKCGAVLVSRDKSILSTGYNGPIRNSYDAHIPKTRPAKYLYLIHSEENAILSYYGSKKDLIGSSIYVTTRPCHRCLRTIIQKGISRIVYAPTRAVCVDESDIQAQNTMIKMLKNKPIMVEYKDISKIIKLISDTGDNII